VSPIIIIIIIIIIDIYVEYNWFFHQSQLMLLAVVLLYVLSTMNMVYTILLIILCNLSVCFDGKFELNYLLQFFSVFALVLILLSVVSW